MNSFLPKSATGLVLALIYIGFALYVICDDRRAQGGGGFLRGLMSRLMVAPVSLTAEWLGKQVNFRSNLQMSAAILLTAILIYCVGFGLGKCAQALFAVFTR